MDWTLYLRMLVGITLAFVFILIAAKILVWIISGKMLKIYSFEETLENIFRNIINGIKNIFKSIVQSIEVKNKFGLYAGRTFLIVFPIWLGIEIGGDWYSFSEVLWGGLWILLGVAVIVKLAFPSK